MKKKMTKRQIMDLERVVRHSRTSSETVTFSAKVDDYTVEMFKKEIEKYNKNNPEKKLKIGLVIENLMRDFYLGLRELDKQNKSEEN